jgi:hypothetical protein
MNSAPFILRDHLSATLLHQLALEGSVRIVATVRTGESVPDAITSLWKDSYLKRLRLTLFNKAQCVGLIEEALDGRVEELSDARSPTSWPRASATATSPTGYSCRRVLSRPDLPLLTRCLRPGGTGDVDQPRPRCIIADRGR